ncbi:uncharacterized protein LOC115836312 [Nomascus leucogenys]|uniref:uncharacterized protein LOC115836312 n=1 Tax=Nomascus leucogenys TaxID=61853 RepID=UPI00122DA9C3|nr:uncharacterized protein LOC115836312 [Nomascus leucogenys]
MGESGWGERAAPGAGAARRQGQGLRAAPGRCHRAPQPCGRRRGAREREGGSEPRRPAARSSNHRSPHPTPPNPAGPTPSAAEESGAGSYNNSARPPDPLPRRRRGRRPPGNPGQAGRGARTRAGWKGPGEVSKSKTLEVLFSWKMALMKKAVAEAAVSLPIHSPGLSFWDSPPTEGPGAVGNSGSAIGSTPSSHSL